MKTIIVLSTLLVLLPNLLAQMITRESRWNDLEVLIPTCKGNGINCFGKAYFTNIYFLGKDSFINGKTYATLLDSIIYKDKFNDINVIKTDSVGFIREEGSRVYLVNLNENTEFLVYDFDLKVYDTFHIKNNDYMVNKVDSTEYNGVKRKTIHLQGELDLTWIEGIGSKESFSYFKFRNFTFENLLLCFYKNNQLQYTNDLNYECVYKNIQENIQETYGNDFLVNPNPCHNTLEVNGENSIKEIVLTDLSGKLMLREFPGNNNSQLDVSTLKKGLYLLKINGTTTLKIMKE